MSEQLNLRARLLLSVQRALLGEVTVNIRAVTCSVDADEVVLRWIIDGAISEELEADLSVLGTEVISEFSDHHISEEFIRCDAPSDIKVLYLDHLAYLRKE